VKSDGAQRSRQDCAAISARLRCNIGVIKKIVKKVTMAHLTTMLACARGQLSIKDSVDILQNRLALLCPVNCHHCRIQTRLDCCTPIQATTGTTSSWPDKTD
jgi:hypothetical protein